MAESKLNLETSSVDKKISSKQAKLDHEEHYDIDGVTKIDGRVVIPSNFRIQTRFLKMPEPKSKSAESKKIPEHEVKSNRLKACKKALRLKLQNRALNLNLKK